MFLLQFCFPKPKWNHTMFLVCHSEVGALLDYGVFGQPEDRATRLTSSVHRKNKSIWSHPMPSKGVTHPYPARALMADLAFMGYKRVILKSDQEPSIAALCDAVKTGWHG